MYAIVESGGKQHRVEVGQRLAVERAWPGVEAGAEVTFEHVLMVRDEEQVKVGKPFVEGSTLTAKVLGEAKGKKLTVFKYTPKKRYRVKTGHRQKYTLLRINDGSESKQEVVSQASTEPADATSSVEAA